MSVPDRKQVSASERVRNLRQMPHGLILILTIMNSPLFWGAVVLLALARAARFEAWNTAICAVIVVPCVIWLFRIARKLHRDIEPDTQPLPDALAQDEVVKQAIARLTLDGGVVRQCHRTVIDAYAKARDR